MIGLCMPPLIMREVLHTEHCGNVFFLVHGIHRYLLGGNEFTPSAKLALAMQLFMLVYDSLWSACGHLTIDKLR